MDKRRVRFLRFFHLRLHSSPIMRLSPLLHEARRVGISEKPVVPQQPIKDVPRRDAERLPPDAHSRYEKSILCINMKECRISFKANRRRETRLIIHYEYFDIKPLSLARPEGRGWLQPLASIPNERSVVCHVSGRLVTILLSVLDYLLCSGG